MAVHDGPLPGSRKLTVRGVRQFLGTVAHTDRFTEAQMAWVYNIVAIIVMFY